MIEIKTKIHDNFSIEFKEGFVVHPRTTTAKGHKAKERLFAVNTWLFIPNSLDINPETYGKEQFYRDVKSNVRMITPVFLLRHLAAPNALPLEHLRLAMMELAASATRQHTAEFEYRIKMCCAIVKSSLRNETLHIAQTKLPHDVVYLSDEYLSNLQCILQNFRALRQIINVPTVPEATRAFYAFGDEYLGHVAALYSFRLLQKIEQVASDAPVHQALLAFISAEEAYKVSMGYPVVREGDDTGNRDVIFRHGILKKFVESDLYINLQKKKDGIAVEQLLYAIAAGIAMVFATIVSFSVQKTYGSLSIPLFFALILSYMLKDRIKELTRYFFAHKLGKKFFDNKATVRIKDQDVGWMKEGVDFITDKKTPKEVLEIRNRSALVSAENQIFDEKIILYRKLVYINGEKLAANNLYDVSGIHDIIRLHVNRFTQKMDNPQQGLSIITPQGTVKEIFGTKVYYLNIVMQVRFDDSISYKRFRLSLTRDGIQEVESFD